VREDARLVLERLGDDDVEPVARDAVGEDAAHVLTLDAERFLDLADLADEEAALLLRQDGQHEAVMLVARSRQRSNIGRCVQCAPSGRGTETAIWCHRRIAWQAKKATPRPSSGNSSCSACSIRSSSCRAVRCSWRSPMRCSRDVARLEKVACQPRPILRSGVSCR